MNVRLIRALLLGAREWRECAHYGIGRTWEGDPDKNNAYDAGVNLGQNLHQVATILRRPLYQHVPD